MMIKTERRQIMSFRSHFRRCVVRAKDVGGQFPRFTFLQRNRVAEYSYESNAVLRASQLVTSKVALSPPPPAGNFRKAREGSVSSFGAASIATGSRPKGGSGRREGGGGREGVG